MRTLRVAAVAAGLAAVVFACSNSNDPDDDEVTYTANLTAAAERTTVTGNPTATGTATLTLDDDKHLTVSVVVSGNLTSDITMSHIHGPASTAESAGIILDFMPSMGAVIAAHTRTGMVVNTTYDLAALSGTGGVLKVSADSLITLLNNGKAYVNVHTTTNTNGEIRGQITR